LLILGGACVYIVTTAVAARVEGRRKEAEVLRLLGASGAFVRGPAIVEGALQGAAGAGIAAVALWILFRLGAGTMGKALGAASLSFLSLQQIALLVAAGAALGAAGAWLATRAPSWPRHAPG
jgi:cell division transport system permease protein